MRLKTLLAFVGSVTLGMQAAAEYMPTMHFDKWHNSYTNSFVSKIFMKRKGEDKPATNLDQCRQLIEAIHGISGGMHQIIYLVGWSHDGHDSKFPNWELVGDCCRSSLSQDPVLSLRAAIREAREKWNCDLSVHINTSDCHKDSPDWKLYNDKKLLRLDSNGNPVKSYSSWYMISHVKDWNSGVAKSRIDRFLEMLPEIRDSKTVHLDAFFARPSEGDGITLEDDKQAIRAQTKYWHEQGIDVTTEFVESIDMIGWFPMFWHLNLDERQRMLYPASLICGGDNAWNARKRIGYRNRPSAENCVPSVGCYYEEAWGIGHFNDMSAAHLNKKILAEKMFSTALLNVWYNYHPLIRHCVTTTSYGVQRADGVKAVVRMADGHLSVTQNGRTVVDGSDYFLDMPYNGGVILAYSNNGCDREFELPPEWNGRCVIKGENWTQGKKIELPVKNNRVQIRLDAGDSLVLRRN